MSLLFEIEAELERAMESQLVNGFDAAIRDAVFEEFAKWIVNKFEQEKWRRPATTLVCSHCSAEWSPLHMCAGLRNEQT